MTRAPPPRQRRHQRHRRRTQADLLDSTGLAATYELYTLAAVVSAFFVLKYVHKTKGKELERMER